MIESVSGAEQVDKKTSAGNDSKYRYGVSVICGGVMRRRCCCGGKKPGGNVFLLIFVLFLLFLLFIQRLQIEKLKNDDDCSINTEQPEYASADAVPVVKTEAGMEQNARLEALVAGAAAQEIGPDAPPAAVQAQCIIARTNLYDTEKTGAAALEILDDESMKKLWKSSYKKNKAFYESCAAETAGEVLLYENDYIYAAYHAVSAGTTRSMAELYADSNMPYLTPVSCPDDTSAKGYLSVYYWERSEFLEMCGQLGGGQVLYDMDAVSVTKRDAGAYVLEVKIGTATVSGEEFRDSFSLESACFTITDLGNKIRVVTKGRGHGFGMSQNTAICMAKAGKDCREIVQTFFEGCEIEKLKENE